MAAIPESKRPATAEEEAAAVAILQKQPEERTEEEIDHIYSWVLKLRNPWFTENTEDVNREICRCLAYEKIAPNTTLFQQGDVADKLYIILHGSVSMWVENDQKDGEYPDLAKQRPTISRIRKLHDDVVHQRIVTPSISRMQVERGHRASQNMGVARRPGKRGPAQIITRRQSESAAMARSIAQLKLQHTKPLQTLGQKNKEKEEQMLGILRAGGPKTAFGELALVSDNTRSATIRTDLQESQFITIDKESFDRVLKSRAQQELEAKVQLMKTFPLFTTVSHTHLAKISLHMRHRKCVDNQLIVKEGTPATHLIFVIKGQVAVTKKAQQADDSKQHKSLKFSQQPKTEVIATFSSGEIVHITEALQEPPAGHPGTVRSVGEAEIFEIHRDDILRRIRHELLEDLLGLPPSPGSASPKP